MKKRYRKCAGIVVFNKNKKVLMCARADKESFEWQFPQGGIEKNESIGEAARRELQEETSITSIEQIITFSEPISYDFPDSLLNSFRRKGIYNFGQEQYWTLFYFKGTDDEINLQTKTPEFKAWEWTEIETAPQKIVDFKKNAYIKMVELIKPYIDNYQI